MKLNRCPICRCNIDIFALAKDKATSQLLGKLAKLDTLTGCALMDYLTLFTPEKTAMTSDKALRLVTELEAKADGDWARLAVAMATTVDIFRGKQQRGEPVKPFNTHGYLDKVLAQMPAPDAQAQAIAQHPKPCGAGQVATLRNGNQTQERPLSATARGLAELEAMKNE